MKTTTLFLFVVVSVALTARISADESLPLRATFYPPPVQWPSGNFGTTTAATDRYLVVSGYENPHGNWSEGTVYVFDLESVSPESPWIVLRSPESNNDGAFGSTLAISDSHLVVGSFEHVWVYDLESATPTAPLYRLEGSFFAGDRPLRAVAIAGHRIAVGCHLLDRVFVYDMESATPAQPSAILSKASSTAEFGWSVAIWENLLVVSSIPHSDDAPPGAVNIFDLSAAVVDTPILTLSPPDPAKKSFGYSVGISQKLIAVGYFDSRWPYPNGTVYVYTNDFFNPAQPSSYLQLDLPAGFGGNIAVNDGRVALGPKGLSYALESPPPPTPEYVLIFDILNLQSYSGTRLDNSLAGSQFGFGYSIALSDNRVAVAAPFGTLAAPRKGAVFLYGTAVPPMPDIEIESPDGTFMFDGAPFYFGNAGPTGQIHQRFTIRNQGNKVLSSVSVAIEGDDLSNFVLTEEPGSSIEAGSSSTFEILFSPNAARFYNAIAQIRSSDPDQDPFTIALSGRRLTPQEEWRESYFGIPDNSGDGADEADPDGDGNDNLFEYTAGLDPTNPASRFQMRIEQLPNDPTHPALVFSPVIEGCTYTVTAKERLTDPTWLPLTDFSTADNGTERTVVDLSSGSSAKFHRIEIARP